MEESEKRTDKRPRTDKDTDVEYTQSRQKKGQRKSIFLSDSNKEAIVKFVKQHEELYKTHIQRQAEEGVSLGKTSSYQELIC